MAIYQDLIDKKTKVAIIGLGYVGLPIALEFARKIKVIGFDINSRRIEMMKNHIDPSKEVGKEMFEGKEIEFTHDLEKLKEASYIEVIKQFKDNYPQTICKITSIGIKAFEEYVKNLQAYLSQK